MAIGAHMWGAHVRLPDTYDLDGDGVCAHG